MIRIKLTTYIVGLFILPTTLIFTSCSSPSVTEEAQAFCHLHKEENWIGHQPYDSAQAFYADYDARVNDVISNQKMKAAIDYLSQYNSSPTLYKTAKAKISEITGEDWECMDYQRFHTVTFQRTTDAPGTRTPDPTAMTVRIGSRGHIKWSNKIYKKSNIQSFKNKIQEIIPSQKTQLHIFTTPQTPAPSLTMLFSLTQELGIKHVTVIPQS